MTKSGEVQGPGGPDRPAKGRGARNVRGGQGAPAGRVRRVAPAPLVFPAAPAPADPSPLSMPAFVARLRSMTAPEALAALAAASAPASAERERALRAKVARIKQELADGTYVIDEDKLVDAFLRRVREWPGG